jgi:very-short-patch-repair endonuclease
MLMSLFLILFALAAVAILVLHELSARSPARDVSWPLMARALLTPREQDLCRRLEELYPQHRVFAQVALSQLLDVRPGTANRQAFRNHFTQLVADFVLCRPDFSVVAVIELDDSSHAATDRRNADRRKTKAVESAGLRLVRIPAGELPSPDELRELIDADDTASSSAAVATNSRTETAALLRPVLAVVLVGLVVVGGWVAYSRIVANLPPRVTIPARIAVAPAAPPPRAPVAATPASAATIQQVEQQRLDAAGALAAQEAEDALEKRKQAAWAAFYQTPADCEHPAAWTDEVECGNQYIRAKRAFEKVWQAQTNMPAPGTGGKPPTVQQ